MTPLTREALADVVGGDLVGHEVHRDGHPAMVSEVVVDASAVNPGSLYAAVLGDPQAVIAATEAGASCWLATDDVAAAVDGLDGGVVVDDVADALLGLGLWLREEVDPTVVALIGDTGAVPLDLPLLAHQAGPVVVARAQETTGAGSDVSLALALCEVTASTTAVACPLGSPAAGTLEDLLVLLRPDVVVLGDLTPPDGGEVPDVPAIVERTAPQAEVLDAVADPTATVEALEDALGGGDGPSATGGGRR